MVWNPSPDAIHQVSQGNEQPSSKTLDTEGVVSKVGSAGNRSSSWTSSLSCSRQQPGGSRMARIRFHTSAPLHTEFAVTQAPLANRLFDKGRSRRNINRGKRAESKDVMIRNMEKPGRVPHHPVKTNDSRTDDLLASTGPYPSLRIPSLAQCIPRPAPGEHTTAVSEKRFSD